MFLFFLYSLVFIYSTNLIALMQQNLFWIGKCIERPKTQFQWICMYQLYFLLVLCCLALCTSFNSRNKYPVIFKKIWHIPYIYIIFFFKQMSILYSITIKYFACFVFLNLFLIHKIKMTFFNIEVDTAIYFSEMVYMKHILSTVAYNQERGTIYL